MKRLRLAIIAFIILVALVLFGCGGPSPDMEAEVHGEPSEAVEAPLAEGQEDEDMLSDHPEATEDTEATEDMESTEDMLPPVSGHQRELIMINELGELQPGTITTSPGSALTLSLSNLSASEATLVLEHGTVTTGLFLPAATQVNADITFTRQVMFVQFDEPGEYRMTCTDNSCIGAVTFLVGRGVGAPSTTE
mgnify:CR=1 FL=1